MQKSWAIKDEVSDELLVHEQGHFNIGILCIREIMEKFKQTKFTKSNFSQLLSNLFKSTTNKYSELTLNYDKETDHSKTKCSKPSGTNFYRRAKRNKLSLPFMIMGGMKHNYKIYCGIKLFKIQSTAI